MQSVMMELAEFFGFNFQATTFPELFQYMFLGLCAVAIVASIIKLFFFLAVNTRKLGR